MFWEIGYTLCTVLTITVAVYVMRDQRGRGRGAIAGFAAGLVAGGITMVVLLVALVMLATPDSRIETVEPITEQRPAT
ncbi:hypothetical protein [Kushneria phyllosphaerae]|uniref:Uncharacterized protein n=1 Tax=Kushneria phyllosphaerae TaxID=2100822 RepID=A0A2R8CR10_9GAMM|nr:hypothetical protein [Kushneria phyllosphaerae]SPJ35234.1 hypothetical protein KSP9073_03292 [Kushneria phyllosphaerae]